MLLKYDFTFEGLLTAVFMMYDEKIKDLQLLRPEQSQPSLFSDMEYIITDDSKASRVWKGIAKKGGVRTQQLLYRVFLSELPQMEALILSFLRVFFQTQGTVVKNPAHPLTSKLLEIQKMIGREKHRMDAFVRFMQTKEGWYVATIAPDFNVLPLNVTHFKNRYADQHWLLYDVKRNYGFFYDQEKVQEVQLALESTAPLTHHIKTFCLSEEETRFQELWKLYFDSTNITSRKNMKLHLQHVPKRYWKYLTEKQPILKK